MFLLTSLVVYHEIHAVIGKNTTSSDLVVKSIIRHDQGRIPEQYNLSDCGIFMCMYAWCLAKRCSLNFNQDDIPNIRYHMVVELLSKTLIINFDIVLFTCIANKYL